MISILSLYAHISLLEQKAYFYPTLHFLYMRLRLFSNSTLPYNECIISWISIYRSPWCIIPWIDVGKWCPCDHCMDIHRTSTEPHSYQSFSTKPFFISVSNFHLSMVELKYFPNWGSIGAGAFIRYCFGAYDKFPVNLL